MAHQLALDAKLSNRSYDRDGQLHIRRTPISKATVNPYYGREIPEAESLGLQPDKVYYLLRDPGELAKAASSFANKQLMFKHIAVSAEDPKQDSIAGTIGSEVAFEAPYLMADMAVWDAEAIAGIETETVRELSASYYYRADMTPGIYEGHRYDGVMRDIKGNHVALVEAGRAGSDVMAADEKEFAFDWEESKHPRSANGEFGTETGEPVRVEVKTQAPFVAEFLKANTSIRTQEEYVKKVPTEKLYKGIELIKKRGDLSAGSQHVEKLLRDELKRRGEKPAADAALEKSMETKFGKALYTILCAASPKLAADSRLKPLVIGLTRKQCDLRSLEPKLLAMDAEMRKPETMAAMEAAKDAAEEEDTDKEREERERKEAEDKKAKDRKAKDGKKRAKDMSFEEWAEEEEKEPEHRAEDEDEEDKAKREEYKKKAEDAMKACDGGFDDLVEKLEKKGYSKEYATKVAGKVAAEKGMTGHGKDSKKAKDESEREKEKAEDKKAMDAKIKLATDALRAEMREAEEAKRTVRPVVGDVLAQDSAADIYAFALDQMKVDHKGVEGVPALRALFNTAHSASKPAARPAFDAVSVEEKFAGASRSISVM